MEELDYGEAEVEADADADDKDTKDEVGCPRIDVHSLHLNSQQISSRIVFSYSGSGIGREGDSQAKTTISRRSGIFAGARG